MGERRKLIERLLNEWLREGAIFADIKILKPATTKRWDIRLGASLAALVDMQLVNPSTGKADWGDRKQLIEALLVGWLKSPAANRGTYMLPRSDVEEAHRQAIAPPSPAKTPYNEKQIRIFAYTVGGGGYADGIAFADAVIHREAQTDQIEALHIAITQHYGNLDVLACFASGLGQPLPVLDIDEAQWSQTLDIDLTAKFLTVRTFAPPMQARGHGNEF